MSCSISHLSLLSCASWPTALDLHVCAVLNCVSGRARGGCEDFSDGCNSTQAIDGN